MSKLIDKIVKLNAEYAQAREKLTDDLGQALADEFKVIVADSPGIYSYEFNQYTPSYNDGDTCEFSCNHQYGVFYKEKDPGDRDYICEYSSQTSESNLLIIKNVKEMLESIPDDFYKCAFGETALITLTRDGEYFNEDYEDHD